MGKCEYCNRYTDSKRSVGGRIGYVCGDSECRQEADEDEKCFREALIAGAYPDDPNY